MKNIRSISLKLWLPLMVIFLFSSLLAITGWMQLKESQSNVTKLSLRFIKQDMTSLQREISNGLKFGNLQAAEQALSSRGVVTQFNVLVALDENGKIMFSTHLAEKGKMADGTLEAFKQEHFLQLQQRNRSKISINDENKFISAYFPLVLSYQAGEIRTAKIGAIYLVYDLSDDIEQSWNQFLLTSSPIWLLLIIAMVSIIGFLNYYVTRPIQYIVAKSRDIAVQKQGVSLQIDGNGELALLGKELNKMNLKLDAQYKFQKESESAIRERENNLAVTLNSIGDAVITTDAKGCVTRMNPVAEELTGWIIQDAIGQPIKAVFAIVNASTRAPIDNPIDKVLETGETVYLSNHTTLIAKDGREYQIADSAAPIRRDDNQIFGMVLVFNDVTESYRLREKAKSIQQQLQSLFNDMQTMVIITNSDGFVDFANNTPLEIANIEKNEVIGKKIWDCFWFNYEPNIQSIIKKNCKEALKGRNVHDDMQIATSKGLLWVELSIHPVLNADGIVVSLLHEWRDISSRKEIEDKIRDSEQHLNLYRKQTPLAAIEWNKDFQVIDWNIAAEKMFGYSLDEVKGRSFVDIMLPESAVVDVKQIWKDLIAQKGGIKSINENLTKSGNIILCEWHNTPLIDKKGVVIGAASLVIDITAEHKLQKTLLKKEQEQREILNSIMESVITFDEAGIILSFNKSAEKLFLYHTEEIIGQNVNQLLAEANSSIHDSYIDQYLKTEGVQNIGIVQEVEGLNKSEQKFPMYLSLAELPSNEDGKRRFIGSCKDLTQIKQQEEQIRRSQKMDALGKLTGGIAHDYNNMLGVVLGYSDLLIKSLEAQPKLSNYASQIYHAGERGAKLTKRLLSFTRKKTIEASNFDINTLLIDQQDMLQKSLTLNIKLTLDLSDDPWSVFLDRGDLEDAIINMCINAMHAMEGQKNSTLTIRTSNNVLNNTDAKQLNIVAGDYIKMNLTDNGCGMDSNTKDKIFDPFFSTKEDKGTGLGLSQVFAFVKRSNGIIKVYSELDKGTEFAIYFPRYLEEGKTAEVINSNDISLEGEGNILIVDDEVSLLALTSELLSKKGYTTFIAENAKQALEILESKPIDLMLTDIILPETNGYQLSAIVQRKYPEIKIQLASGFTDERHSEEVDKSLSDNLIHKPFNSHYLYKKIKKLLTTKSITSHRFQNKNIVAKEKKVEQLEWLDKYQVGISEIDNDHKILFSLINGCITIANSGMSMNQLSIIFKELIDYSQYHFEREEKIMEVCNFPQLDEHKNEHKVLVKMIQDNNKEYEDGNLTASQLLIFLIHWLQEHIAGKDKSITPYSKGKNDIIQQALKGL